MITMDKGGVIMHGKIFGWTVGILITAFLVVAGLFLYQIYQDVDNTANDSEQKKETAVETNARETASGNISKEELEDFKEQGLNPFGESIEQEELTDKHYQEYIHGMSHQKVRANEKWGFYKITKDRIEWLIEGLDKVDLTHEETYETILSKWQKGDFSTADDDHNAIWTLQGGTIGKATGILTPEEEQEYLNNN